MISLFISAAVLLVLFITQLISSFLSYRLFKLFSKYHECSRLPAQPKSFFHKFRLVSQKYGNIFEDYYLPKFQRYGATHAMYDWLGRPKVIHTIDPVNLHAVLVDSFEDWGVFTGKRNSLKPLAQKGILTTDGHVWLRNRKYLHRKVNTKRGKDTAAAEKDTEQLFKAIDVSQSNGGVVNITALVQNMAIDMSSRQLFGVSTDLQLGVIRHDRGGDGSWRALMREYVETWGTLRDYISLRSAMGSKYWMVDGWKYRRACSRFRGFADMFITKARERSFAALKSGEGERSLIDELVEKVQDLNEVREFVLELVIAGQNMIGTTLEWALAELSHHPEIYARLRTELLSIFHPSDLSNSSTLAATPPPQLTHSTLQSCRMLQHIISETLRCHPPVATMSRTASRDTVLPRGGGTHGDEPVAVPRGCTLTSNIYLVHRQAEVWGDDSWEWKPDRWEGRKIKGGGGEGYVPFGAGMRICLGRQMSLTDMSYVLARFALRYEAIQPADKGSNGLAYQYRSILSPKSAVTVVLKEARDLGIEL